MLSFAIQTFRYSHMDLFSHLGCLVCGILSFVFLIYSNAFLIFWHSHKCTFSYLYFLQSGCPSFTKYQFCLSLFCHYQQDVPSFVCPSFTSLPYFIGYFTEKIWVGLFCSSTLPFIPIYCKVLTHFLRQFMPSRGWECIDA